MRVLAIGATSVFLSGCAWMGGQASQHHGSYHHSGPSYYAPQSHYRVPNRTNFEASIAAEGFSGGNVSTGAIDTNGDQLNKIAYKDAYKTGWRTTGGLSYDAGPRSRFTVDGFYKEADAKDTSFEAGTLAGGAQVNGSFSDYKSYGAEIGFREYLNNRHASMRPYLGGTVGGSYVEEIDIIAPSGNTIARLYDGEWVPTASALIGFELPTSRNSSLGLETGLRYEGKRDIAISNSFGKGNDNYSIPVRLRGRFQF